jgi:membrane protease YdiL (CAAX protease family)
MGWILLSTGVLATWAGWWAIRAQGVSIWRVMPPIYAVLGIIGVLLKPDPGGRPRAWYGWVGGHVAPFLLVGLASGVALFVATRIAVRVLVRWEAFARQTREQYEPAASVSLATALALSLVTLAGEELLWRWAVQQGFGVDAALATGMALGGYVVANLASGSLPILAGALVGGALWGVLSWVTGGVLAPLASHAVWTALMVVLPPPAARGKMDA